MTRVFSAYGIPITPAALARNADDAVAAAKPYLAAGTAAVIKIVFADIVHKREPAAASASI